MPSDYILKIDCPYYLIRFIKAIYGKQPIVFPQKDNISRALSHLLLKPSKTLEEVNEVFSTTDFDKDEYLFINLNYYKDSDPRVYNDLSNRGKLLLLKRIKSFFKLVFHEELTESLHNGYTKKDSIYLFMDKFDLPEDCFDLLTKDYTRYYDLKYYKKRKKKIRESKKLNDINIE
jgi:hypothetical protein